MKSSFFALFSLLCIILFSCKSDTNSAELLSKFSGRYLYTEDETIHVHSKDGKLLLDWRGAKDIQPMKVNDNTFYVKDMNAKIQFLVNPEDQKEYLVFVPKEKDKALEYKHVKVTSEYKTPSQYFAEENYEKALEGYLKIKEKDSLNPIIEEWRLNRKGYYALNDKKYKKALEIFKLNIALHPNSANVYDSYAEGLLRSGDTINAIANYEKVLSMDSGSRNAKRKLEKLKNIDQ